MPDRTDLAPDTIVPATMPIPLCLGIVPAELWVGTFQTDQDVLQYWRRYALGCGVCRFADHRASGNSHVALGLRKSGIHRFAVSI